ncbi:MAG TPA: SMC-Scp complex subunit ScpB [Candidatus Magasanikbacteria bacterium]|uniref:Segregation and condensation protein B n=2 Tax=Candidatus Magasanikiibacteriota TaxID=1752731 RepID=A0A0G0WL12_9BACT|nr:MAG: Segregation and condensation protein B [Candidatus Magasanikbacteria bacterium GW2011_GWC2_41_17]KKS13515.1 MAG: Segregation and condensation protein B [Candidatus Magasanikbacteria bacterium GW2011_GWA2_41_55]HBV57864.1 SMC-Scp complex subunit ScpB [Candidatus Magasanikbacteria bacterium]
MSLTSKLESILFIAGKPLAFKKLAGLAECKEKEVEDVIKILKEKYNQAESGLQIMTDGKEAQFMTNPQNSELVKEYVKDETTGELTRPSLETLTIIAYRGPITKLEMEQIRGVNCSLILRNLMMRGLIKAEEDKTRADTVYSVTFDFLKFLGIHESSELPDFKKLRSNDLLDKLLNDAQQTN